MRSAHHLWAYNPQPKNPHFLPDFYLWGWISSLAFSKLSLEFLVYFSLEFASLAVYGFSSVFNENEEPHLPDLPLLKCDCFSGLVLILDVVSEFIHSLTMCYYSDLVIFQI